MTLAVIDSLATATAVAGAAPRIATTGAFTPASGEVLLNLGALDSVGGSNPAGPPTASSSPSQTWTQLQWRQNSDGSPAGLDGQASIHRAVLASAPGSSTASLQNGVTGSSSNGLAARLLRFTGAAASPIGANGKGGQAGGTSISQTYTPTAGSMGVMAVCDWNAGSTAAVVAASGCTIIAKATIAGEVSYYFVRRTSADGVGSLGIATLPASGVWSWAYAEVLAAAGGPAWPPPVLSQYSGIC